MSVALMITSKQGTAVDVYVPVATQQGYHDTCIPIARGLGLKWLPLFETGFPVGPEDILEVAGEFKQLRERVAQDPSLCAFAERLDRVVEVLEQYAGRDDVEVAIG